jgi:lipid-binding SYLF domain-containing protein
MSIDRRTALGLTAGAVMLAARPAAAADAAEIDARVDRAIQEMYATVPGSEELHGRAAGLLMMPKVVKGGLIIGGAYGEGALRIDGATAGYYSVAQASFGLQAGVQSTKQALFFMTEAALTKFQNSRGWEVGADAEVTFPGNGLAAALNTTTSTSPVIGVVFGQDGLLAGASLEGGKYTRITPE